MQRSNPKAYKKYKSSRWKKARSIFLKENPLCVNFSECKNFASHVDHIKPVESDPRLDDNAFWDTNNWQGLCLKCHSRKTAKQDGGFGNMKLTDKKIKKIKIILYSKEGCKPCEYMLNKINSIAPNFRENITDIELKKMMSPDEAKFWLKIYRASGFPLTLFIYKDDKGNEKTERLEGDVTVDSLSAFIKKVIDSED